MRISDWSSDVCSSDLVPMFETMVAFLMVEHLYAKGFEPPLGPTGYARLTTPHRKPYRTKDGYVCILPYSDKQWAGFFEIAGRPQLKDDPRFRDHATRTEHVDEIYQILDRKSTRLNSST